MKVKSLQSRDRIIKIAEKEFLKKGFQNASLRNIAKEAKATTGIIYTYFKNKDELFEYLVSPAVSKIENILRKKQDSFLSASGKENFNPEIWFTRNIRFLVQLIEGHSVEMKLLFLKAQGSKFSNYKSYLIKKGTERSVASFRGLKRNKNFEDQKISVFFVNNLVRYVLNVAIEILKENKNRHEIEYYQKEITAFLYSGWKALAEF